MKRSRKGMNEEQKHVVNENKSDISSIMTWIRFVKMNQWESTQQLESPWNKICAIEFIKSPFFN